jgi:DNA-binding CsgD family transcriptional regulator
VHLSEWVRLDDPVWRTLTSDPRTGVLVLSAHGEVCYVNAKAVEIFRGKDSGQPSAYVGRNVRDFYPAAIVQERMAVLAEVDRTGRPLMMRTIWRGRQVLSWIHPLDPTRTEEVRCRYLVISRHATAEEEEEVVRDGGVRLVESEFVHLGELDELTPRELEVLALIGQGLSIKEIADILHRAPKTVERHREAIGKKLNASNRVLVAEIARRAGLTVEDAGRKRVRSV